MFTLLRSRIHSFCYRFVLSVHTPAQSLRLDSKTMPKQWGVQITPLRIKGNTVWNGSQYLSLELGIFAPTLFVSVRLRLIKQTWQKMLQKRRAARSSEHLVKLLLFLAYSVFTHRLQMSPFSKFPFSCRSSVNARGKYIFFSLFYRNTKQCERGHIVGIF